jgi:hypothetical protein
MLGKAINRWEQLGADGDFQDWVVQHAKQGVDIVYGQELPKDFVEVTTWVRFVDAGWKRRLSFSWIGTAPWGRDGYWVAEDTSLFSPEIMVIFASDLEQPLFRNLGRIQWEKWWQEREVDPQFELPGGSRLPVSARAKALLSQGEARPRSKAEWMSLWMERDGDVKGTWAQQATSIATAGLPTKKLSMWQRLIGTDGRNK